MPLGDPDIFETQRNATAACFGDNLHEKLRSQNEKMRLALINLIGSSDPEEIKRIIACLEAAALIYGDDEAQNVRRSILAANILLEIINEG